MAEWQVARLIPTSGISSDTEAEVRATSALLSVMSIVRDFSESLLTPIGASSAKRAIVEAFIEISFKLSDGTTVRPDGLVRVGYGKTSFTALVEVKTGDNPLRVEQVNAYWEVARQYGFDAVITISNEIGQGGQHPTEGLKVRANSKVRVQHYSWTEILSTAVMCKVHRGVDDPEQAWILGELIRYLEHSSSGAMTFSDMGPTWVPVRDAARTSTLAKNDPQVRDIVQRWDQLLRFAALRLGAEIGADVQQVLPRSQQDPKNRTAHLTDHLCGEGVLEGSLRVPNTVGPISITADLRGRHLSAAVDVAAPPDRGAKGRLTWLLRQLGPKVPTNLTIEVWPRHARQPITATLAQVLENRDILDDPDKREVHHYRLVLRGEMGMGRKAGGKSPGFVDTVLTVLERFYGTVVQHIVPWVPKAPQLKAVDTPTDRTVPTEPPEPVDSRDDAEDAMDDAVERADAEARTPPNDDPDDLDDDPTDLVPAAPVWASASWSESNGQD